MLNVFGPCFKTGRTRPCSLSRLLFDTQRKQIDTSLNQGSRFSHKCENTALFWNKRSHLFPCLKPSMKVGLKPPTRNQILTVRKTNFEKRPPSTTETGQDSTGRNNSSFAQEFSETTTMERASTQHVWHCQTSQSQQEDYGKTDHRGPIASGEPVQHTHMRYPRSGLLKLLLIATRAGTIRCRSNFR